MTAGICSDCTIEMTAASDYIELHAHSYFSLLDGASSPEALVERAAQLGMTALALTDHDAVYGAVRFESAARATGIHAIFGAELTLVGGSHLTLLVENERGWGNLCWLISQARGNAPKGEAALARHLLERHTTGLIALSGCHKGEIASALLRGDPRAAGEAACFYRDVFGTDRFWIELQHHKQPGTPKLLFKLVTLARQIGVGYVATNNVHYATNDSHEMQDVLTCVRQGTTLDDPLGGRRSNAEYYLKSARQMAELFTAYPAALTNTRRIAERCHFVPQYGLQDLPTFPTPAGLSGEQYLRQLCEEGLLRRFPDRPVAAVTALDHELRVISRAGLANYFLIVWDIVRFARENGIRCQGRGSAANSLVAYLLAISPIDPLAHNLVFERFLSDERRSTPDIDIDFQADRREEVIQYVYGRYGADYTAMACTFVTFRERSARREVGKVLGLPPEVIESAVRHVHARNRGDLNQAAGTGSSLPNGFSAGESEQRAQYDRLCAQIKGLPRYLGIHNGGMIITGVPLAMRVPTEPATMPDRVVCQWDKNGLEDAGLIKIDVLGLRMLSAIAEALDILGETTGAPPDLDNLTLDDPTVYQMISRADTIGVFQVESRAQAQVLPRIQPRAFADLIVSISLIRPGPVQGNMVHPYLRRRLHEEPVIYAHPLLEPALAETLGVILFQEQVLKVARDLGQFTAGQGEQLRRALGKNDAEGIARFQAAFVAGAEANGIAGAVAAEVFGQLKAFGGYSFPKSHAAAFAVLVYQSAWLKCYYPAAFYTALLNNQPMGFWSPAVIVNDARHHGIRILAVDVNHSRANCTIEDGGIRIGFRYVRGLGEAGADRLEAARGAIPFSDLADFCARTRSHIPRKLVEQLILVGALDSWSIARRQLLWELGQVRRSDDELDLAFVHEVVTLPALSRAEALRAEYLILGLSTGDHIMALYRAVLNDAGILGSAALTRCADGERVRIAGQVVVHQSPPTAKGHHFVTLEDENGLMNVIVRPDVVTQTNKLPQWQGYGLNGATLVLVEGIVQHKGDVINVVATGIFPLTVDSVAK